MCISRQGLLHPIPPQPAGRAPKASKGLSVGPWTRSHRPASRPLLLPPPCGSCLHCGGAKGAQGPPQFSSVQFSHSVMSDSATPWTTARQASLSITSSRSLPKPMSIDSVMPSNHLILCRPFSSCPQFSLHQGLFQWVSSSHQVAKVLELQLQHQSFQWIVRVDFL